LSVFTWCWIFCWIHLYLFVGSRSLKGTDYVTFAIDLTRVWCWQSTRAMLLNKVWYDNINRVKGERLWKPFCSRIFLKILFSFYSHNLAYDTRDHMKFFFYILHVSWNDKSIGRLSESIQIYESFFSVRLYITSAFGWQNMIARFYITLECCWWKFHCNQFFFFSICCFSQQ
jgi:hypothetical protein